MTNYHELYMITIKIYDLYNRESSNQKKEVRLRRDISQFYKFKSNSRNICANLHKTSKVSID